MDSERWRRVKEVFQQAVELGPDERRAFVERECGDDSELLAEVLSLVESDLGDAGFLEVPAAGPDRTEAMPEPRKEGDRVGPYKILRKVGEGGMGEVYEADQREPVRRRVALKVIKRGMDSREVIARFESERQALALMSHRSIARVFDAGTTPRGRPYFAMEYVEGIPITEYCDRQRLPARERLTLFLEVCLAVQHAHQKGIIHRDLKPSNILVKVEEGTAVPKVIDFGVAKATAHRLTEKTLFTQLGQWVGTPEYMSPEQADLTGLDVDTRTDVYALGVVLYELLVGAKPFDPETLRRAGFDEVRRVIREEDPPKPSTRVSSLGAGSTEAAKNRRVDAAVLRRDLEGDLDAITMKALEKDRTRRYGSPTELASDVERYMRDEPVLASPPSVVYRARKFVRRNKVLVGAAGLVALTLLVGGITTLWQARIARVERARAEKRFNDVRSLAHAFIFEVYDGIENLAGATPVRELVVKRALEYLDSLAAEAAGDRGLQEELAAAYSRVGDVQGMTSQANLGDYAGARKSYERAIEILAGLHASEPDDVELRQQLARAHLRRADLLAATSSAAEAASGFETALALVEATPRLSDASAALVTAGKGRLADIRRQQGNYSESARLNREILGLEEEALIRDPTGIEARRSIAIAQMAIAFDLDLAGEHSAAVEHLGSSLAVMEPLVSENESHAPLRRELTVLQREAAMQLGLVGKGELALELLEKAIRTVGELQELDPPNQLLRGDQGVNYTEYGRLLTLEGRAEEALSEFDRALRVEQGLAPEYRRSGEVRRYVVRIHRFRAGALANLERFEEARRAYLAGIVIGEEVLREDPSRVELRIDLASAFLGLVPVQLLLGDCEAAAEAYDRGREIEQSLRDQSIASLSLRRADGLEERVAGCE